MSQPNYFTISISIIAFFSHEIYFTRQRLINQRLEILQFRRISLFDFYVNSRVSIIVNKHEAYFHVAASCEIYTHMISSVSGINNFSKPAQNRAM